MILLRDLQTMLNLMFYLKFKYEEKDYTYKKMYNGDDLIVILMFDRKKWDENTSSQWLEDNGYFCIINTVKMKKYIKYRIGHNDNNYKKYRTVREENNISYVISCG